MLINDTLPKMTTSVKVGDVLAMTLPKLKTLKLIAEDIPLQVLFEDEDIIVLNKDAGIVVHPTEKGGHFSGTIVNALLHHAPDSFSGVKGEQRPGIVHRLDKDTSGVLIVAKHDEALSTLSKQFQDRSTVKEYLALVRGRPSVDHGKIDAPIGRDELDRKKMAVTAHSSARHALTEFWVEEVYKGYSLLRVRIHTGRTHQIRVHLASIGHPIVGDIIYGDRSINAEFRQEFMLTRQFLHAAKLGLRHPRTHEWMWFEAPLSEDLKLVLDRLRSA